MIDDNRNPEFLLPARNVYIVLSVVVALLLNEFPHQGWQAAYPDFVTLVLLYWCAHKPFRVGIGIAWALGIISDISDATLFGQHAAAYAVLAFGGIVLSRRIQMFDLQRQMLQVYPVLLLSYATYSIINWQLQGYVSWQYFLGSLTTCVLWAPASLLMRALRRARSEPDSYESR